APRDRHGDRRGGRRAGPGARRTPRPAQSAPVDRVAPDGRGPMRREAPMRPEDALGENGSPSVAAEELDRLLARVRRPLTDGFGFLVAAGVLPDRDRHIEWWQRGSTGFVQLRLNLDPTSVDVYEYFEMEWFAAGRDEGRGAIHGPYVDYFGADRYVFTFALPVIDDVFLGGAGGDLQMHGFEPCLLAALRETTHDAVLVGPERRVIAANTPRGLVGSRLPETPRAGVGEFVAVGEVGL